MKISVTDAVKRRNALFVLFFLPGLGIASWVTRTPDVRDAVGASTAQMGLILFGLSLGSMVGILAAGAAVAWLGARRVVSVGTLLLTFGVAVIGVGTALGSGLVVALGLGLFGLGMGAGEIALNVEGAEVEQLLARSVMPLMHGFFSLGTLLGALVGMFLTAAAFPVVSHLVIVSVLVLLMYLFAIRRIVKETGRRSRVALTGLQARRRPVWRDPRLILIGGIILALAMAEGTANDWLPLVMVDGHGFDPAFGSAAYAIFAGSMVLGRFFGGWFVDRFGRVAVLGSSAALGAVGLAVVAFADHHGAVVAAVVLWGIGTSLGFPVALSAAAESGPDSTARVSFAATIGYIAFLVGPPTLGLVGEEVGLRNAMVLVLALVAAAIFLCPAARHGDRAA